MKAYIVSDSRNGRESIDGIYYLITEEGEVLASHWCSHIGYAMGDLYSNRLARIKEYTERFGEFNVDYLGCDDITMEEIIARNHKWAEEHPELVG